MSVLLLATVDTKREETHFIQQALTAYGLKTDVLDLSIETKGHQLSAVEKIAGMEQSAARAIERVMKDGMRGIKVAVAIGGGTGGQMALQVLQSLPVGMPKVFVSTLPFDPRYAVADTSIIIVPTVADLMGLNSTTRWALEQACLIAKSLYGVTPQETHLTSIGMTSLGVTGPGADAIYSRLKEAGHEVTIFHSNGFGGAAFAKCAKNGAFNSVIDYTPHEVTRCHLAGVHVPMPHRFTAMGHIPRVLLPGGVNFIGMGHASLMPEEYRKRPHYSHSPLFTHVKCTVNEVAKCANVIGNALEQSTAPLRVLVPMRGFSSEDDVGGAIEDKELRVVFADQLERYVPVDRIDTHINDDATAEAAVSALMEII